MKPVILFLFAAALFVSCASTRVIPLPSESSGDYRGLQGELHQRQADIAVIGQKIEDQGRGLIDDLTGLEKAIADLDAGEAGRLVHAARAKAENHVADIESLNRQLAAERETVRKQDRKFNEYEAAMIAQLSDRDTENAELREEVKAAKGRRDTLLAIVITAVSVALLFVVFKVLRFFKASPF